jgi:hypothetical protein
VYCPALEPPEAYACAAEKKSLHAQERDSDENRQRRQQFVAKIRSTPTEKLIFLDESGVTTSMTRLYACSSDGGVSTKQRLVVTGKS